MMLNKQNYKLIVLVLFLIIIFSVFITYTRKSGQTNAEIALKAALKTHYSFNGKPPLLIDGSSYLNSQWQPLIIIKDKTHVIDALMAELEKPGNSVETNNSILNFLNDYITYSKNNGTIVPTASDQWLFTSKIKKKLVSVKDIEIRRRLNETLLLIKSLNNDL